LIASVIGLAGLSMAHAAYAASDRAVWRDRNDTSLNPAIAEARKTLPRFWVKVDTRPPGFSEPSVKVGFPTQHGGIEFLWISVEGHSAVEAWGQILNQPEDVPSVHEGQEVRVRNSKITDWSYVKGGKIFGQFTTRVLNKTDERMRRETSPYLAPTALEPGAN
jgi:uncharacterized protein YegJ (DUF2314 family)